MYIKTFGGRRWLLTVLWKISLCSNDFCSHKKIPHPFLQAKPRARCSFSPGCFGKTLYAFQSWVQVPTDRTGLTLPRHCPAARFQTNHFSCLLCLYFSTLSVTKKRRGLRCWLDSPKFPEMLLQLPFLRCCRGGRRVQLCWGATGCHPGCWSKAATPACCSP